MGVYTSSLALRTLSREFATNSRGGRISPHSPKCEEEEFCELRVYDVLGSGGVWRGVFGGFPTSGVVG